MRIVKTKHRGKWYGRLLRWSLDQGIRFFPRVFIHKVPFDGHDLNLPRWVTDIEMDEREKRAEELVNKIRWD